MTTSTLQLAWDAPARDWTEAIPIGDGRLGAMVFGGASGRYQINDAWIWSGHPDGPANALTEVLATGAGPLRLRDVRNAITDGELDHAEELLMSFEGRYTQEFLPFVDLFIGIPQAEVATARPARVLDLDVGFVEEHLELGGTPVRRRSRVTDHALVVEFESEVPLPNVTVTWSTPLLETGRSAALDHMTLDVEVPIDGAPLHEASVHPALRYRSGAADSFGFDGFACAALALDSDGDVETTAEGLVVTGARHGVIALASASRAEAWWADSSGPWRTSPPAAIRTLAVDRAKAAASAAARPNTVRLGRAETSQYARFAIGGRREGCWNVQRDVLTGNDDALRATIIAEFGRYLLSSASHAGGPAANLQGIWNGDLRPAWSSNYTININTQMNYWAAGPLGIAESAEPLISLVERIAETGRPAAERLYGARGWVAHHNSDMWGWSLPVGMGHGAASWAIWMMGGPWLCHSLWDLVAFSGDDELLRTRIWPLMQGAAEFCLDWMRHGDDGIAYLNPSTSPENMYTDPDGHPRAIGFTSTIDLELTRSLFQRSLQAIDRVDPDSSLKAALNDALAVLPDVSVARDGHLQEWSADVVDHDPLHRHLSPLVGLYPLDLISLDHEPSIAEAARKTLDSRGPGAMGWSWAWKIALRARLGDGDIAHALLQEALTPFAGDTDRHGPVDGSVWGGLLPNLLSTHPPFQIDGNLGMPAAIAELLLQSHVGSIDLLPALPTAWPNGRVEGLRARGGVAVDLTWSAGHLERAVLHDKLGISRDLVVRYRDARTRVHLPHGGTVEAFTPLKTPSTRYTASQPE